MITVEYTLEHYVESADDHIEVDLVCEVEIEGTDPSVGIFSPSAELQSAVDSDDKDWFPMLDKRDIEAIEIAALEQGEEHIKIPRRYRGKYAELI